MGTLSSGSRRRLFAIPSILTLLLLGVFAGLHRLLQDIDGPVRAVTYVPGKTDVPGFWILMDAVPEPVARLTAHLHSRKPFHLGASTLGDPGLPVASLYANGKCLRIISLGGETQSLQTAPGKGGHALKIGKEGKGLLTLLLPGDSADALPRMESSDSGRTHFIAAGPRRILVHTGAAGDWSAPGLRLTSNSPFLVASWEHRPEDPAGITRTVLGRDGSRTIWGVDTIRFPRRKSEGGVQVWEEGRIHASRPPDTLPSAGKARGLRSPPRAPKGRLSGLEGYRWKFERPYRAPAWAGPGGGGSFFLPESLLSVIRADTGSWKRMVKAYRAVASYLEAPSLADEKDYAYLVAYAALLARLDDDPRARSEVVRALLALDGKPLGFDSFSEVRARQGWWYLTAFDVILPMLPAGEAELIRGRLEAYLAPILADIPYVAMNATSLLLKSTIGMAGFMLGRPDWTELMVNHLDWYLDHGVRDGIAYEGNFYLGIGFERVPAFIHALKSSGMGGVDFFLDSRFQTLIAALIAQLSPSGDFPCFEDCDHGTWLNQLIAASGRGFAALDDGLPGSPLTGLSERCAWVEHNARIPGQDWLPNLPLFASHPGPLPVAPTFAGLSHRAGRLPADGPQADFNPSGGSAVFRNGWGPGTEMFALSAKGYDQSHTRMDELSFELWAGGERWLGNPEYPGFGAENHARLSTTQATNSLTIDGHGQVDPKGAALRNGIAQGSIQYVEADGSRLYRHPERKILWRLGILAGFAVILMWAAAMLAYFRAPDAEGFAEFKASRKHSRIPAQASGKGLAGRVLFAPTLVREDLRKLSILLVDGQGKLGWREVEKVGLAFQALLVGGVACTFIAAYLGVLLPYVRLYASDDRYAWMRGFLAHYRLLYPASIAAGAALIAMNYGLLRGLQSFPESAGRAGERMMRGAMRIAYADLTSLLLIAAALGAAWLAWADNLRFTLTQANPDPWNFQSHLCSYAYRPLAGLLLFLLLKVAVQTLAARKYGLLLLHVTGERRWFDYGFATALVAITSKKVIWVTASLAVFYVLLWGAGRISAETLTLGP